MRCGTGSTGKRSATATRRNKGPSSIFLPPPYSGWRFFAAGCFARERLLFGPYPGLRLSAGAADPIRPAGVAASFFLGAFVGAVSGAAAQRVRPVPSGLREAGPASFWRNVFCRGRIECGGFEDLTPPPSRSGRLNPDRGAGRTLSGFGTACRSEALPQRVTAVRAPAGGSLPRARRHSPPTLRQRPRRGGRG